jgi:hypothetical protein
LYCLTTLFFFHFQFTFNIKQTCPLIAVQIDVGSISGVTSDTGELESIIIASEGC